MCHDIKTAACCRVNEELVSVMCIAKCTDAKTFVIEGRYFHSYLLVYATFLFSLYHSICIG